MTSETSSVAEPDPESSSDVSSTDDDLLLAELRVARREHRDDSAPISFPLPAQQRYEVVREIRRGGQGIVYEALQLATGRRVALKVLLHGEYSSERHRRRFEREVDLLASLNHPNVVTLHDSGWFGDQLFYAMEYIDGVPLHHFDALRWPCEGRSRQWRQHLERVLEFFTSLCKAVVYCQQRGLIHRDLKPGNVMVNKEGQPVLVDFGLARPVHFDRLADGELTETGDFIGTLAYAAPEQAAADLPIVDVRCDVYALGAILYELLTGQRAVVAGANPLETLRRIQEQTPERPSQLNPHVDSDLETIALKALARNPDRRYQSADELLRDIERRRQHLPIDARSDSTWYVVSQRLRKHKLPVTLATGLLVLVMASSFVMFQLWKNAVAQTEEAGFQTYVASLYAADAANSEHRRLDAVDLLTRPDKKYRGWEWDYLFSQLDMSDRCYQIGKSGDNTICWAHDRSRHLFVTMGTQGSLRVTDVDSGHLIAKAENNFVARAVTIDKTNQRLLMADREGTLHVCPLNTRTAPPQNQGDTENQSENTIIWSLLDTEVSNISALAAHPDGQRIYLATGTEGSWDGRFQVCDANGQPVAGSRRVGMTAVGIAIHPEGQFLAVGSDKLQIRNAEDGRLVKSVEPQFSIPQQSLYALTDLAYSDDGQMLVAGTNSTSAFLWDVSNPKQPQQVAELSQHDGPVAGVAFSPDGKLIATSSHDQCVRLWNANDGTLRSVFHGMIGWGRGVMFTADGSRLVAAEARHQLSVYRTSLHPGDWQTQRHQSSILTVRFSPNGQLLASGSADNVIHLTSVETGEALMTLNGHKDSVQSLAWSADSDWLLSGDLEGRVLLWDISSDIASSTPRLISAQQTPVRSVLFCEADTMAVIGCENGRVSMFDLKNDGKQIGEWSADESVLSVTSIDRGRSLVVSTTGLLQIVDLASRQTVRQITREPHHHFSSLARNPLRASVAVGSNSGQTTEWELATGKKLGTWAWHQMSPTAAAFHPDGSRIVTAGSDGGVKIWDTMRYAELLRLKLNGSFAYALDWSPDGLRIAAGCYDGRLVMFEAVSGSRRKNRTSAPSVKQAVPRAEVDHAKR